MAKKKHNPQEIDLDSKFAEDLMGKTLSDASDMLTFTALVAVKHGEIDEDRVDELDKIASDVTGATMDAIFDDAGDPLDGYLVLGQVAINLIATFLDRGQKALDASRIFDALENYVK